MKIAIISGSHRKDSQSAKVGRYVKAQLDARDDISETWQLDLAHADLPFWDESIWQGDEGWKKRWGPIAQQLRESDGLVVIAPEWGGMVPAMLKNFFLLTSSAELADKPALIVGVSGSRGGSYPINELRTSSYKNIYLNYIPQHVIVRDAPKVLNDGEAQSDDDRFIRGRMNWSLAMLAEYSKALRNVRESGVADYKTYPFGM